MGENHNKVIYLASHAGERSVLLEKVFREHGDSLRRFLRMKLVPEADQEDLIQDLFVRLARSENLSERLSDESGNTRYYLFSMLSSMIVDKQRYLLRRKMDQHDTFEDDAVPAQQPTTESRVATQQSIDRALQILKQMNPKCREAFVLNRFKSMSYSEISVEMGVSVSSVERYVSTALSRLRKGLR